VTEKTPVLAGLVSAFPQKYPQEREALGSSLRNSVDARHLRAGGNRDPRERLLNIGDAVHIKRRSATTDFRAAGRSQVQMPSSKYPAVWLPVYSDIGSCGTTASKNCSGLGDSGQDGTPLGIASHGCFRLVQMWAAGERL
jgi:hypothetical protein